ncbi:hypothetical protein ACSBR1_000582 [Camellia fascicularis]
MENLVRLWTFQSKEVAGILLPIDGRTCLLQEKQNSKREIEWLELKPCLYKHRV